MKPDRVLSRAITVFGLIITFGTPLMAPWVLMGSAYLLQFEWEQNPERYPDIFADDPIGATIPIFGLAILVVLVIAVL